MPMMKADTEIRVADGANVFTVGTTPTNVPEFLVAAATSAGAQLADKPAAQKPATKVTKTEAQ